jgi:hypothetical protein
MINPTSEYDLSKRITQRLRQANIESQILEIIDRVYKEVLDKEHILLARPEKARLYFQSVKTILRDMLADIEREK